MGAARVLYARILERIEAADYDVFASRARVPTVAKAALAAGWWPRATRRRWSAAPDRRHGRARLGLRRPVVLVDEAGAATDGPEVRDFYDTPDAFASHVVDDDGSSARHHPRGEETEPPGVLTDTVRGERSPARTWTPPSAAAPGTSRAEVGAPRLAPPRSPNWPLQAAIAQNEVRPVFVARALGPVIAPDGGGRPTPRRLPWSEVPAGDVLAGGDGPCRAGAPSRCRCSRPSAPSSSLARGWLSRRPVRPARRHGRAR